jgi:hypothetical protein
MDISKSNHLKNFSKALQHYLDLEIYINNKNKEIKKIKEQRTLLEQKLTKFIETNNLTATHFSVNNSQIKYNEIKQAPSLSLKLITEVLQETLQDKKLVQKILDNIQKKKNTLTKKSKGLKIKY